MRKILILKNLHQFLVLSLKCNNSHTITPPIIFSKSSETNCNYPEYAPQWYQKSIIARILCLAFHFHETQNPSSCSKFQSILKIFSSLSNLEYSKSQNTWCNSNSNRVRVHLISSLLISKTVSSIKYQYSKPCGSISYNLIILMYFEAYKYF